MEGPPARSLVLTSPVPLPGGISTAHLAPLVAADVLLRQARTTGGALRWQASALFGGPAAQRAAEDELVHEGLDKAVIGREAFAARLDACRDRAQADLAAAASALALGLDAGNAVRAGEAAAEAARTAFVRLFDAGVVRRGDRVVGACPVCRSTVGPPGTVPAQLDADVLTVRVELADDGAGEAHLDAPCLAAELLPGTVAVAVPEGHPAAGRFADVPLAPSMVPVVEDSGVARPTFVMPAHDQPAFELARRQGLPSVPVLDPDGFVRSAGPLEGLARYAARSSARQLLEAERVVVTAAPGVEEVERCAACRSVLVPLLGTHWLLSAIDLETAAADAIRDGRLAVWPAAAREDLLAGAGTADEWCLSRQLWAGVPVPVGRCLDCGHVDVSVDPTPSCGSCMGDLVPETDVLDARFVRCLVPLSVTGWPEAGRGDAESTAGPVLFLMRGGAGGDDVLAMVGLGLRLDGAVPFDEVAVLPWTHSVDEVDPSAPVDVQALVAREGTPTVRLALLGGALDVRAARELVARLDQAGPARTDVVVEAAMDAAFAAAAPAAALDVLAAASEGAGALGTATVQELTGPFVGR